MIRVLECRYVTGYTVWLRFNDGVEGELNLEGELEGEVFDALRDLQVFRSVSLHPELHTIVWPNGADFAPEFLHDCMQDAAQPGVAAERPGLPSGGKSSGKNAAGGSVQPLGRAAR